MGIEKKQMINKVSFRQKMLNYKRHPFSFIVFLLTVAAAIAAVGVFLLLVGDILIKGIPNIKPELFAWESNSKNVSTMPAIINTLILTVISLLIAVPLGVFAAIYMAEYAKKDNKLVPIVRMTAETLSGIPSIVYGLFGFILFNMTLGWGYSLLGGIITVSIMILPLIMRTAEEALLSVPVSYREGSFGLGAGKLRTVFRIVLPSAMPGILSGIILAIGRIVGESAALIFTSGSNAAVAEDLFSSAGTLSVHMYTLLSEGLHTEEAYATAVVLLIIVLLINTASSFVAKKLTGKNGKAV